MDVDDILITPLDIIPNPKGDIYHALKSTSPGYQGFGEVYFSSIRKGLIKGWKRHNKLTLNLVVPVGEIRFVIYDERLFSNKRGMFTDITLGSKNYVRLTLPCGLWVAFQGVGEVNLLMNLIAEEHNYRESDNVDLNMISYSNW